MNLKMQMRPRRAAGVADVGNDLPGFDLLACGDADARAVRVQCRQSTAVVELDVVAITAAPTVEGVGDSDGAVGSRQDRGAFGHSDVGAAVVAGFASDRVGAVALRRGDRARHRQRPLQRAATQRGTRPKTPSTRLPSRGRQASENFCLSRPRIWIIKPNATASTI